MMETLAQMSALQFTNQCIANHQQVCHLSSLAYVDKLTKMDIAESFAVQGLQHASVGRDAVAGTVAGGGFPAHERKVA